MEEKLPSESQLNDPWANTITNCNEPQREVSPAPALLKRSKMTKSSQRKTFQKPTIAPPAISSSASSYKNGQAPQKQKRKQSLQLRDEPEPIVSKQPKLPVYLMNPNDPEHSAEEKKRIRKCQQTRKFHMERKAKAQEAEVLAVNREAAGKQILDLTTENAALKENLNKALALVAQLKQDNVDLQWRVGQLEEQIDCYREFDFGNSVELKDLDLDTLLNFDPSKEIFDVSG